MARNNRYGHFCPTAHTLEIIGEKWSLLVVRDLLGSLRNITSKGPSNRLRDLEEAGIVLRDSLEGRREVWYSLTGKGRELAPVLQELATWGTKHAIRPPLHDEAVLPAQVIYALVYFLNKAPITRTEPAVWVFRFPGGLAFTLRFDGKRWVSNQGEVESDVIVETMPAALAALLAAGPEESGALADRLDIDGEPARVEELMAAFGANALAT